MKKLLAEYNTKQEKSFDALLDFHYWFERIHPFQDGNGRIGRLLLFKDCLKYNIVPFIIGEDLKLFYYRGLKEWENERGYLRDTPEVESTQTTEIEKTLSPAHQSAKRPTFSRQRRQSI